MLTSMSDNFNEWRSSSIPVFRRADINLNVAGKLKRPIVREADQDR